MNELRDGFKILFELLKETFLYFWNRHIAYFFGFGPYAKKNKQYWRIVKDHKYGVNRIIDKKP